MAKMKLAGLSKVNEGQSKKNGNPYKMQDAHFIGKSLAVDGETVCKTTLDLLNDSDKLPELLIGGLYIVDVSDRGYLQSLELLEKPVQETQVKNRPQVTA